MKSNHILRMFTAVLLVVGTAAAVAQVPAQAQGFPSKVIRVVVPLGGGSGFDTGVRRFAEQFSKIVGQPVIVENKPGGGTSIGVGEALRAPADGYTVLALTGATVTINPALGENMTYDLNDIRPLAGGMRTSSVIVVGPQSPYKTLQELLAAAKKNPGTVSIAAYGQAYKLGILNLEKHAGVRLLQVPYKSPAEATQNTVGGQVDASFLESSAAVQLIKAGQLRALAQTGTDRHPFLPSVPTVAESGLPDYSLYIWSGFAVSAKTPEPIAKQLESAMLKTYASEAIRDYASTTGAELHQWPEKNLKAMIAKELQNNKNAVAYANKR
ncbi:tripartite tricarboxylate transporter substrate binding protein [Variovorax sp. DT-64]|uniref:tripartite tricarboxylate transporter substrate binding protein n=1 Tax=Variovorax sp. DT-64 TaxID=3396160 RepID=UPI003F1D7BF5